MERTRRGSRLVGSTVAWTVFLLMWIQISVSPSILAASHIGLLGTGVTSCDGSTYNAVTEGIMPWMLWIDDGDDLYFYYNVSWNDDRSSDSTVAYHNFTLTVTLASVPSQDSREIETYGQTWDRDTILVVLYDVDDGQWVYVEWEADIYVTSTSCSDNDKDGPLGIYLI